MFDDSIPKLRFYARYLTHVWVYINTLSLEIRDAMCGYRVYPLAACANLIQNVALEERMAFDVEILVRLYWEDNLRISLTHARLFLGMLIRLPGLVARHFR